VPDVVKGLAFLELGIQHSFTFCLEKNCFNLSAIILLFNNVGEEEWDHNRLSAIAHIEGCAHKVGTLLVCYSGGIRFMSWPRDW